MYTPLLHHIKKFIQLDADDIQQIIPYLEYNKLKKKELLLQQGELCNKQYFIVKGCCRMYINNEKGQEQTTQFAIENWWITDYLGFHNHSTTDFNIQAIEETEIVSIDSSAFEELLAKVPKLERYFRLILQKAFGASQFRIKFLFTLSAEERYHHFNNLFPDFVQRVPQYMIASYLDFSPEFLSKIRAGKL